MLYGLHLVHWWLALHAHRDPPVGRERLLVVEGLRIGTGTHVAIAGVFVVEHIGMRIVLLFCTHGINLGRTEFYKEKKERGGAACRVALYELEM